MCFLCVGNPPPGGHAFQEIFVTVIGPLQLIKVSLRYVDFRVSKISVKARIFLLVDLWQLIFRSRVVGTKKKYIKKLWK